MKLPLRALSVLGCLAMIAVLYTASTGFAEVGDPSSPASTHVSPRYIEHALKDTGSPNLVTAVLADYRGYDTLGETIVIFTGGAAALLILRAADKKNFFGGD
ncbi:MAG: hypothetical protein GX318_01425 [Clostridia bacterium]|nr:hypothetical protein [Clostridia bacterium]